MAAARAKSNESLADALAHALPEGAKFTFYHISTPPTKCAAIFSAPPGARPERTYCESHFLNVSITPEDEKHAGEVFAFAIEVLIYATSHLTTVFVSKADSTGYLSLLALPRSHTSPVRAISTNFIAWLVKHRQRPGTRLVVSLFARAQDQYLFPASIDNPNKHVADDTALVKWWCRVLDPVLRDYAPEAPSSDTDTAADQEADRITAQGHLIIPGFERNDTSRFFPQTVRSDPQDQKRWKHGHPLLDISRHPTAPPRCLIPHFPDDPKSRYMDELDDEIPDGGNQSITSPSKGNGQWRSVRSLAQFWEMMSFRQECSSGRLVGFIWVVFTPPDLDTAVEDDTSESQTASLAEMILSPDRKKRQEHSRSPKSRRRRLTGPIIPRMPRIKSGSSNNSSTSASEDSKYYVWPPASRGQIVLDEKDYKRANELLLHQNFGKHDIAVISTKKWIDQVAVLGALNGGWGRVVVGKKAAPAANINANGVAVNTLNTAMVRRKRKPEAEATGPQPTGSVNNLSNLVRKKPKAEDSPSISESSEGVNVLNTNLVRKKPKA